MRFAPSRRTRLASTRANIVVRHNPLRPGLPSDPFVSDLCIAPREAIAPRPASASAPDWGVDAPARQRMVAARRAEREQGPHPGHTCDQGQTHTQPLGCPTAPSGFSFPTGAPFNNDLGFNTMMYRRVKVK